MALVKTVKTVKVAETVLNTNAVLLFRLIDLAKAKGDLVTVATACDTLADMDTARGNTAGVYVWRIAAYGAWADYHASQGDHEAAARAERNMARLTREQTEAGV